jgi:septal ring factor EnvC (AmiA/AmiB activator)
VRVRALAPALVLLALAALAGARAADGPAAPGAADAGPAALPRARQLEGLRRAIEERRQRVEAFEREQRGLLDALEAIDRAVAELEADAALRQREADAAIAREQELEAALPDLEGRLARTRRAMSARVVALYKTGELGPAQVLFAAASLRDLIERIDALGRLLAHDRALVGRFRAEEDAVADARRQTREAEARRVEAAAQLAERRSDLARERAGKQELLASVQGDGARESAALGELEAAAQGLEQTLAKLGEAGAAPAGPAPADAVPFERLRGHLPPPVDAPVVSGFGRQIDAQFHTKIEHKGIDFAAPLGADVRAVAAGRVRFAGWFRGYGKIVILDHGDGFFTVCGHLGDVLVKVDDEVAAGQVVGSVGDTGSLSGAGLYFELRQGSDAIDPVAWLGSRASPVPGARDPRAPAG